MVQYRMQVTINNVCGSELSYLTVTEMSGKYSVHKLDMDSIET